jgi:hypothetical protein
MKSIVNIQTEVRISDILELLRAGKCKDYICHNIAYLLRNEIAKVPGYDDYHERHFINPADEYDMMENSAIPYYFLDYESIPHFDLSEQVVSQLNEWIVKFDPKMTRYVSGFLDEYPMSMVVYGVYCSNGRKNRMGLLEKILKVDSDAVLSINM